MTKQFQITEYEGDLASIGLFNGLLLSDCRVTVRPLVELENTLAEIDSIQLILDITGPPLSENYVNSVANDAVAADADAATVHVVRLRPTRLVNPPDGGRVQDLWTMQSSARFDGEPADQIAAKYFHEGKGPLSLRIAQLQGRVRGLQVDADGRGYDIGKAQQSLGEAERNYGMAQVCLCVPFFLISSCLLINNTASIHGNGRFQRVSHGN